MISRRLVGLAIMAFSFPPALAVGDDLASLADARVVADAAIAKFKEEKFAEGYGALQPYWPIPPEEVQAIVSETATQWPIVRQRFGATIATEFVQEIRSGQSFARYVYLQKFEHHALRWLITFYKPRDRWMVNAVSFDDDIDALFP